MRSVATAGSIDDISVSTWVNDKMERMSPIWLHVDRGLQFVKPTRSPDNIPSYRSIGIVPEPDRSFRQHVALRFQLRSLSDFFGSCNVWPCSNVFVEAFVDYGLLVRDVEAALPGAYTSGRACLSLACPTRSYDDAYNIALWSEDVDEKIHVTKYPQDIS
ncbi:hypothetical protein PsorP6_001347 [Peronosclerospora sorghi]|uniref:Uncharacterized protein n=1 Tax=Peronosclerospora sorghi TaxID=230839 RepID=A0ACC0WT65_9STRA|nr:hypothetical protein PsorP6_001347 [Peronosclerospora sorghi]